MRDESDFKTPIDFCHCVGEPLLQLYCSRSILQRNCGSGKVLSQFLRVHRVTSRSAFQSRSISGSSDFDITAGLTSIAEIGKSPADMRII